MKYTIYIERDQFPDPKRYPDGIAWRSGVIDAVTDEEIDGSGDLETFEEAKELATSLLNRLLMPEIVTCPKCGKITLALGFDGNCKECNQ